MAGYPEGKFCTVLTDASFCPKQRVGGWAVWIVCEDERYKRFDAFFELLATSQEAEIKAIINGLWIANRLFSPDHFHVVSDCTTAMAAISRSGTKWNAKVLEIIGERRLTFKHVKAHSGVGDRRSYVNEWCDFHAKMAMKRQRNEYTEVPCGKESR